MKAKSKENYAVTRCRELNREIKRVRDAAPDLLAALQQARLALQDVSEAVCDGKTQEACELADEAAECCQIAITKATEGSAPCLS